MHEAIHAEIIKARTADAHRRADEVRLAQAFKQDRPALRRDDMRRLLQRLRLRPVMRRLTAAVSRAAVHAAPAG
jgi:hypothetical protein